MVHTSHRLVACGLCIVSLAVLTATLQAQYVIADQTSNPHSDLIFRATGAKACSDCHGVARAGGLDSRPLDNDLVRNLRGKAIGIHGPGRFADCLRCHAGGSKGVEKY